MDAADRAAWRAARAELGRLRCDWSEAQVALLARRWGEGLSASVIARELGVSRSAVLGKVHRLKLKQPETKLRRVGRKRPPRWPRLGRRRRSRSGGQGALQAAFRALGLQPPAGAVAAAVAHASAGEAFGTPCGLLDLTADTCRWPVGDPGDRKFAFCGAKPLVGYPYCVGHCLIAYRADDAAGAPPAQGVSKPNLRRAIARAA